MDTTGSGSSALFSKSLKRKNLDINWGGAREGAGRKKKFPTSASHPTQAQPPAQPLVAGVGLSTQTLSAANPHLASPIPLSQPVTAAVGFFAPRLPLIYNPITNGGTRTLGSPLVDRGGVEGPQGVRIAPEQEPQSPALIITVPEYNQLERDLTYIKDHDEFLDVASGNSVIEDSLSNEILEPTSDPATDAEAESQASEAREQSSIHRHLSSALKQIKKEIKAHGWPESYRRGDFFYRPKHAVFALHDAAVTGLQPDHLCARDIFLWLPACLPGAPDSFKCTCGGRLSKNGWNDNPIARRVRFLPVDYFLLTNRFLCDPDRHNEAGCGTSWQGTDPHIIGQLPRFVSVAFPAYISASGAIDKTMMSQMCNAFATRFGPAPFAEMTSELQHNYHAELELMYYDAARSLGLRGSLIPAFSSFGDPLRYAGSSPSVHYLKAMFVDWLMAHRIFIERAQASLPANVMKVDHTFDYLKYMGGLNGERIHEASYTNVNHFEEIRSLSLVPSKSLEFVVDQLKGVAAGLKEHGHPACSLVYTDSPQMEQGFHESITPSLKQDVEHVTPWTDLPLFESAPGTSCQFTDDTLVMHDLCSDILEQVTKMPLSLYLIGVGVHLLSASATGELSTVQAIQIRTQDQNLIFRMSNITLRSHFPSSLRAILTNSSIIKIGYHIQQVLQDIGTSYNDPDIIRAAKSNASLIDISQYAKLKGVISDATSTSLQYLVGTILKKCSTPPILPASDLWVPEYTRSLHHNIEAIWQVYLFLSSKDSVGLPLVPFQAASNGLLVTLYHSQKAVAEGCLVWPHNGYIEAIDNDMGSCRRINITATRSLIQLTRIITPAAIHTLHAQSIQWIFDHGGLTVVTTSTLRTRNAIPPSQPSSPSATAFAFPLSPTSPESLISNENFTVSFPLELENQSQLSMPVRVDEDDTASQEVDDPENTDSQMQILEYFGEELEKPQNTTESTNEPLISSKLPTRVLDDAFHFMDRIFRLLPKKHTAFRAFAHDFSEAIFLRDRDDEARVRAVLERKGINWDYARRAHSPSLNRRIRRYIPPRDILVPRLETLFNGYKDVICTAQTGRARNFFSKDAREMSERLLDTARRGFVSDPPGIPLYYRMGIDRDGLTVYRTIRGTNSVEGGVHMAVRRVFGSLQASPELAECLLLNWMLRRNKTVGHRNRTGQKYSGHFVPWLTDEITELTTELGVTPSFTPPPILVTRIATSETFGLVPLSNQLAEKFNITTLPTRCITGVPHHHDTPVHTLTRLSTKPINRYRYIQLRQHTLYPVTPVHTYAEYAKFKYCINDQQFRRKTRKTYPAHDAHKLIDFEKVAVYWNSEVEKQSRTEIDSSKRIYYKLPSQLERHHKKTLTWKSECSTMFLGGNAAALKPFRDLLSNDNTTETLAPASLPEVPGGVKDDCYQEKDFACLNIAAFDAHINLQPISEQPAFQSVQAQPDSTLTQRDPLPTSPLASSEHNIHHSSQNQQTVLTPTTTAFTFSFAVPSAEPVANPDKSDSPSRCAPCTKALCIKRHTCGGRIRRENCSCGHPVLQKGERVRISEKEITKRLASRDNEIRV